MIVKSLWTTLASTGAVSVALAATLTFNDALTGGDSAVARPQINRSDTTRANAAANDRARLASSAFDFNLGAGAGVRVIVIDAGHGGRDLGCLGHTHGTQEKEVVLKLALALRARLLERHPDIQVVLTRERDVFVPLHERARVANRAQADLFLSLHCNALPSAPRVGGSESYVMGLHTAQHNLDVAKRENAAIHLEADAGHDHYDFDPESAAGHITLSMFQHAFLEQSMALAGDIEAALGARDGRRSRGVKQAGFLVLKETAMPSVLVETGYLTNPAEEAYLAGGDGQAETVEALYRGVEAYMRQRRREAATPRPVLASQPSSGEPVPMASSTDVSGARLVPVPGEEPSAAQHRLAAITEPDRPLEAHVANDPPASAIPNKTTAAAEARSAAMVASPPSATAEDVEPSAQQPAIYVQLSASAETLRTDGGKWVRLGHAVRTVREGDYYKYQAGPFGSVAAANQVKRAAREGDFPDAFVIGYEGERKMKRSELDALD